MGIKTTKILHKRGLESNLPTLSTSELAYTTDSKKLFVGGNDKNVELASGESINAIEKTATSAMAIANEANTLATSLKKKVANAITSAGIKTSSSDTIDSIVSNISNIKNTVINTIHTLPNQVTDIGVKVAGSGALLAEWEYPADSFLSDFVLVYKKSSIPSNMTDGTALTFKTSEKSALIDGLENGYYYYFRPFTRNVYKEVQTIYEYASAKTNAGSAVALSWRAIASQGVYSLTVDSSENIYVVGFGGKVLKYSSLGTLQWTGSTSGTGTGVCTDDEFIYATDGNGYLYKINVSNGSTSTSKYKLYTKSATDMFLEGDYIYSRSYDYVAKTLKNDFSDVSLYSTSSIGSVEMAYNKAKDLFYVAMKDGSIIVLDKNLKLVSTFPNISTREIYSIGIDALGNIYTIDYFNTFTKLDANGNKVLSKKNVGVGTKMKVGLSGDCYFRGSISGGESIVKLDNAGERIWEYTYSSSDGPMYDLAILKDNSLIAGTDGRALFKLVQS